MKLTIVIDDNLTLIDDNSQYFDLSVYDFPENFRALQWYGQEGEIEYNNNSNEFITTLPSWSEPVIKEHQRLTEESISKEEEIKRQQLYIGNGQARKDRIKKQKEQELRETVANLQAKFKQLSLDPNHHPAT